MQVEALAVRLRPRTPMEAADLGVRLCQDSARSVYACFAMAAVPVIALALASYGIRPWLPALIVFCAKPWLDQSILFVLSRAAFGQNTTPGDLWRARRQVWWRQILFTWIVRRLSLWRSLTQPIYQLEGLSIREAQPRVRQIRRRTVAAALMMTHAFAMGETAIAVSLFSLFFWLAPSGLTPDIGQVLAGQVEGPLAFAFPVVYAAAVLIVEPFYVAAGFAMYLNRRAELEAWDIEQEFRRAFAQ